VGTRVLLGQEVLPGGVVALTFDPKSEIVCLTRNDVTRNNVVQKLVINSSTPGGKLDGLKAKGTSFGLSVDRDGKVIALSPEGSKLASLLRGRVVRLYDTTTGHQVGSPLVQDDEVASVAISRDGDTVLTGGKDGSTRLWAAPTGIQLGPPWKDPTDHGITHTVAFGKEEKTLLAGGSGGIARLLTRPQPVADDPARIRLWIEVITGHDIDEQDRIRELTVADWTARYRRLATLAGVITEPVPSTLEKAFATEAGSGRDPQSGASHLRGYAAGSSKTPPRNGPARR
jgi:WD40 repeat protein